MDTNERYKWMVILGGLAVFCLGVVTESWWALLGIPWLVFIRGALKYLFDEKEALHYFLVILIAANMVLLPAAFISFGRQIRRQESEEIVTNLRLINEKTPSYICRTALA